MVECGGFFVVAFANWLCAVRRLPERWNDASGGRSRTGPAFYDPGRRPLHLLARNFYLVRRCASLTCFLHIGALGVVELHSRSCAQKFGVASRCSEIGCLQAKLARLQPLPSGGRERACASSTLRTAPARAHGFAARSHASMLSGRTGRGSPKSLHQCSERHAER